MRDLIVLGFDVGAKKTGVAIGQTLTQSARALHKITCHEGIPIDITQITDLITLWRPQAIVVGIPHRPDGKMQRATRHAFAFIEALKQQCNLPIYEIDEQLTTKSARSAIYEDGGYRHLQKSDVDSYAAKLIVESWLNEQVGLSNSPFSADTLV
jgi:putative Holliday junction resolvase